jgi:type I restriction enzyme S subunit
VLFRSQLDGANLTENAAKIVVDKSAMSSQFLDYFLKTPLAQEVIERLSTSTTQAKLALFRIETIVMPLPPLAEQERIVEILEEQFSRLDKALEVANQLEARIASERRSLLHSAFTGALTATWRENND